MSDLIDSLGRKFEYLRLSVTESCNFKCSYCLPNGYQSPSTVSAPLSVSEIKNLIAGFAQLGFWKVRLTGGEPLLRRDICEIAQAVKSQPEIRELALSTNGYRLLKLLPSLKDAGITSLNVSLDSLDSERFRALTGRNLGEVVKKSVETAACSGDFKVKANAVLMRSTWQKEVKLFQEWIKNVPVTLRFIELMRTGQNAELYRAEHISSEHLQELLLHEGWMPKLREAGSGPAIEFVHPVFQGRLGIIAPYSKSFCQSCNRLRVTSKGQLQLCLFGKGNHSLRHYLQYEEQKGELVSLISELIRQKLPAHNLALNDFGITTSLSQVGG